MTANVQFHACNHYNQELSGLVFVRELRQVPGSQYDFRKIWTLHILHAHPAPENVMSCCSSMSFLEGNHQQTETTKKIQDCIATFCGIGWMGIEGTEVQNEVFIHNSSNNQFERASGYIEKYVVDNLPPTDEEQQKIERATKGALKSTIEMETIGFIPK